MSSTPDAVDAPAGGPRRMAPLTLENLGDLPAPCRRCVVWELDAAAAAQAARSGDPAFEKEAWLSSLLLTWGLAGRVAYVGEEPVGFVAVAPPVHVPRAVALPSSPVSADAVLLTAGRLDPRHRGAGIARMLVQGVAKDLTRRGVRAIEAFALDGAADAAGPGAGSEGAGAAPPCLLPRGFLEAVGFTVVREHPRVPRLRLELRSALAWREDVEAALEQLLGSLSLAGAR
ncbi:MAG: FIG007808: N-acetyltransferase [uncultured Quadrisphaera sp.]|uniref:FIG007808: N-acetyltransferase n=1 Tax=uncultured Quadrisphaera sp. TaxID=904978 RepID=A0A6J4PPU1_9ACTN|nr:MAG: FIG007808: N-acetyltransferase [uncultured Quadrisphaera sp.]